MRTAHTNRTDEPIKIRYKKLSDGKSSIYLDTYINGKRSYEFLKLYLYPGDDKDVAAKNEETKRQAELIKQSRLSKLSAGSSVTSDVIKADSPLQEKDVTANVVNETPQKEKKKRNRVSITRCWNLQKLSSIRLISLLWLSSNNQPKSRKLKRSAVYILG